MSGICTSVTAQSTRSQTGSSRNSCADENDTTSNPPALTRRASDVRADLSSSITATLTLKPPSHLAARWNISFHRKDKLQCGAMVGILVCPDSPTMVLDD